MAVSDAFVKELRKKFAQAADPANAVFQKAYMKNQFAFFGIRTEARRLITKEHFKQHPVADQERLQQIVMQLWELPQREFQYAGQELMYHCRAIWTTDTIHLIEYCITHKSWWDTVDYLSTYGAGQWLRVFPAETPRCASSWNRSGNMWLNRCSVLFQLKYKERTDKKMLGNHIIRLSHSKEFFIQKAIGWALREYSKTDRDWVRQFIRSHQLAPLSVREGSKYLA